MEIFIYFDCIFTYCEPYPSQLLYYVNSKFKLKKVFWIEICQWGFAKLSNYVCTNGAEGALDVLTLTKEKNVLKQMLILITMLLKSDDSFVATYA